MNWNNSKNRLSSHKSRYTKFISTWRPLHSCVYPHHAAFVGNSAGTNAPKLNDNFKWETPDLVSSVSRLKGWWLKFWKEECAANFVLQRKVTQLEPAIWTFLVQFSIQNSIKLVTPFLRSGELIIATQGVLRWSNDSQILQSPKWIIHKVAYLVSKFHSKILVLFEKTWQSNHKNVLVDMYKLLWIRAFVIDMFCQKVWKFIVFTMKLGMYLGMYCTWNSTKFQTHWIIATHLVSHW